MIVAGYVLVLKASYLYLHTFPQLSLGCFSDVVVILTLSILLNKKCISEVRLRQSLTHTLLTTVRLCSDRLGLIKDCLSQLPTNYKQSAKLLGLANLLRVAGKLL